MREDANTENKTNAQKPGQKMTRRFLISGMAATAAAVFLKQSTGQIVQAGLPKDSLALGDPTKVLGPMPSALGNRSPFEKPVRKLSDTSSRTPLQDLYGTLTPSDLHFERHHGGIPAIDPNKYELVIHGMVARPTVFTLSDLKRFPSFSRIFFLECSGNYRGGKEALMPQDICGLTSQSEWTGVLLSTLFREVGIHPKAAWFLAEGSDAAVMTRSIPVNKGLEDGLIAYAQNGEALRPAQGYPARLVLPGWEGNTCVKWIRRIEVSDQPFMTREETAKYTEPVKGKVRRFSFVMDARSIITFPTYPSIVQKGWIEIRGIAWSGRGRIVRVEISTDGGKNWYPAALQAPVLDKAHTAFRYLWQWNGKATEIMSRAVDETGYTQPGLQQLKKARGSDTGGYHMNPVVAWQIKSDGTVWLRPESIR